MRRARCKRKADRSVVACYVEACNVDVLLWPQVAGVVASSAVGGDEIRLDPPKARLHLHSLKLSTPSTLSKHLLPNVEQQQTFGNTLL